MALPVNFDADSAARIYRAVREVERGNRDQKPLTFERVIEQNPRVFRLCRFSGAWQTGTDKTVTLEGKTATLAARNLFYPITAAVSDKPCAVAKSNGSWLLISVPFQTATAVGISAVSTILRIAPEHTTPVTALSAQTTGSQAIITGISAVLDTANCNIMLTLATTTISLALSGTTTSFVALTTSATATASVIESTQVLSFLRFAD